MGGFVIGNEELINRMKPVVNDTCLTMAAHEAWLCIRGLKTLHLRMAKHTDNGMEIAKFLEVHRKIDWVRYPGLPSHPQHAIAKQQMSGFGGMLSFGVIGGLEAGRKLMDSIELCSLAVSLGEVDSLIQHPALMTHSGIPEAVRIKTGITDNLVRLSVGIEEPEDIITDINQALNAI